MDKKIILMVCRGNIARSPVAEMVLNEELKKKHLENQYIAISRGVQGTSVDPVPVKFSNIRFYKNLYLEMKPALDRLYIDISHHRSKPVDREAAESANVILAMDNKTKQDLLKLYPDLYMKIHLLSKISNSNRDFVDPESVSGTEKHFQIFSDIKETVVTGFSKLLEVLMD